MKWFSVLFGLFYCKGELEEIYVLASDGLYVAVELLPAVYIKNPLIN